MWSGSKDIARDAGYDLRRRARAVRPVCCNTHIIPMNVNAVYPRLSKTIGDGIGASCASGYARCNWSGKLATTHLDQIQSNISIFLAYTVNGNNEGWLPAQELFEIFLSRSSRDCTHDPAPRGDASRPGPWHQADRAIRRHEHHLRSEHAGARE